MVYAGIHRFPGRCPGDKKTAKKGEIGKHFAVNVAAGQRRVIYTTKFFIRGRHEKYFRGNAVAGVFCLDFHV